MYLLAKMGDHNMKIEISVFMSLLTWNFQKSWTDRRCQPPHCEIFDIRNIYLQFQRPQRSGYKTRTQATAKHCAFHENTINDLRLILPCNKWLNSMKVFLMDCSKGIQSVCQKGQRKFMEFARKGLIYRRLKDYEPKK